MNTATEGQRADIVALRAFAVAAVLLFHAALPGFRGGFIGVDVFFVISGYLMTRIIVGDLDAGRFTLAGFYLSRVRRIVPALAVMCAFVLAIGYWRLAPPDYAANAMHALTSLLFVSNFDYLRKASYFNALGSENWLLHTWSLSLEFQFYLLYPLVLVALHRWRRRPGALVWWVAGLFGLSYLLSALPARWQPWPMFYVLPTRAWEMLGGGLVCLTPFIATRAAAHRRALFWAALLALMLCVATMSSALRWPGRAALLPVLATMLMLWAHHDAAWPVRPRAVQWLGNASYSIYLWHWPLFALVMQWPLSPAPGTALGVAASLVAGALSWRWVEGPGRRWWSVSKPGTWPASWALSALMLASIAGAAWVAARDGLPQREAMREYPQIVQRVRYVNLDDGACFVDNRSLNIAYRPEYSKCDRGDRAASRAVLLWGDSHAGHFEPLVDTLAQDAHVRLRVLGTPECWPTLRGEKLGINPAVCAHFRDDVVRSAKEFDTIVLAARWDATARNDWQGDLRYTLDTLSAAGKKIVVLRQVPVFDTDVAHRWVYDRLFGHTPRARYARLRDADAPNEIVRHMVTATANARFVDATASLCAGSGSQCDVVDGDTVLYADDQHLSVDGAVLLARRLVAADQNFLR